MFSIKIKNINFFSRYIVWAADCLLSVLATSFSFLFLPLPDEGRYRCHYRYINPRPLTGD